MALTKEDLQSISSLMDTKLSPVIERLDRVEKEVQLMKEAQSKRHSQLADKVEKNTKQTKKLSEQVKKTNEQIKRTNVQVKKNAEDIKKL